jgi:hypothetical protein
MVRVEKIKLCPIDRREERIQREEEEEGELLWRYPNRS